VQKTLPEPPVSEPRDHASIIDVANLAGVSPTTVSRALRGLKHVSPLTRARVEAAASELSYVASPAGSGLASGRTFSVGVVVPIVTRWFFAQVVAGAATVLREAGYDLLLYNLVDASGREQFFERMPLRRRVDAVLVVSLPLAGHEVSSLRDLGAPIVTVGSRDPAFPGVRIDDAEGTRQAIRHLVNLGHESVAMISALEDDDMGFAAAIDRRIAFREALPDATQNPHIVAGMWGLQGGQSAMAALLGGEKLPTAVFAEYDEMAFGAVTTLRKAGLRIPGDVSIVGFDNHELAVMADLTTVAQPVREQGEVAARLLLDGLSGASDPETDVVLPTHLVVRGSTAPARHPHGLRRGVGPAVASSP
jgi:LacI family repressor for deo operon, udp, cdd, tsx, nupC, and nupG